MRQVRNKKWETKSGEKNRIAKSEKNQNVWRKKTLVFLRNIGSGHYETSGDERKKIEKSTSDEGEAPCQKCHQRNKLGAILELRLMKQKTS